MRVVTLKLYVYMFIGMLALLALLTLTHEETHAARHDVLYICPNCPLCEFNAEMVSTQGGTCRCGKQLVEHHVIRIENSFAFICRCESGSNCGMAGAEAEKCINGQPVLKINLQGKDIWFCNCGGSCTTVSHRSGKCQCGRNYQKA